MHKAMFTKLSKEATKIKIPVYHPCIVNYIIVLNSFQIRVEKQCCFVLLKGFGLTHTSKHWGSQWIWLSWATFRPPFSELWLPYLCVCTHMRKFKFNLSCVLLIKISLPIWHVQYHSMLLCWYSNLQLAKVKNYLTALPSAERSRMTSINTKYQ